MENVKIFSPGPTPFGAVAFGTRPPFAWFRMAGDAPDYLVVQERALPDEEYSENVATEYCLYRYPAVTRKQCN